MTIDVRSLEQQGVVLGREGLDRAQAVIADLAERVGEAAAEAAADAPRFVGSVADMARDTAPELTGELRGLWARPDPTRNALGINRVQGLAIVGVIVVALAVCAAVIQRSRRRSAERRRRTSKKAS